MSSAAAQARGAARATLATTMRERSSQTEPASPVYQHDPDAVGDEAFEPGTLAHLIAGRSARMLDPRRTPVKVIGVDPARGEFEVEVGAFEDAGARWRLPIEDVARFQFPLGSEKLAGDEVEELERGVAEFARRITIPVVVEDRERTLLDLASERARIHPAIAGEPALRELVLADCVRERSGSAAAASLLQGLLEDTGLAGLERALTATYVSNPNSGEIVKGHAIVIAEMGLCPYTGKAVRDEAIFDGDGSRDHRRRHILLRLAFLRELASVLGLETVELYRGTAITGLLEQRRPTSLLAATFSREVAMSHFDSDADAALLARQRVPVSRLFMTFLETPAMTDRYREAEAALIGDPANPLF